MERAKDEEKMKKNYLIEIIIDQYGLKIQLFNSDNPNDVYVVRCSELFELGISPDSPFIKDNALLCAVIKRLEREKTRTRCALFDHAISELEKIKTGQE